MAGKVAWVTGAASPQGMGFAAAKLMAGQGACVMLTDIHDSVAERAAELRAAGLRAASQILDVAQEDSWKAAMAATLAAFGKLDVLVNNAGVALLQPITACSVEDFERIASVNLRGVFIGTREAVAQMRAQGHGGSIVNVSSVAGTVGVNWMSIYAATKGGVRMFSKSIALETAREGIRCNSVHPGMIDTAFFHAAAAIDPAVSSAIIGAIPVGRLGRAEEVAQCILFLASDEAGYVTGAEFVVDGGYSAQ